MANRSIRYGASLRKRYGAVQVQKKALYMCDVCGKEAVKRIGTGMWKCRHCGAVFAGGAYTLKTEPGKALERMMQSGKVGS
jgi:large subunit ribosomal protein L37Ae